MKEDPKIKTQVQGWHWRLICRSYCKSKNIRSAQTNQRNLRGKKAPPQCSRARGSIVRDVHIIKKNTKAKKHKDDRLTRPWGRRECMLEYVLQGPPMFTHAFKAKQTHERKENPPRTPNKTNKPLNRATPAKKTEKTQHAATPQKLRDRQARRSTSKTQDYGWTGKPTTVPLTPGSKTRVLRANNCKRTKEKQADKTTRASNTRKLAKHNKHTSDTTQRKTKARPRRGERGTS